MSTAYDFTQSGSGDYTIKPSNLFTYVDADGIPKNLYATVQDTAKVKLSGDLASRVHNKRATFNGCSVDQQSDINAAASGAQDYSKKTSAYVSGITDSTERYTTWFGEYDDGRRTTVQDHFNLINSRDFSNDFTYDCTCTDTSVYAYVCAYISTVRL